MRSVGILLLAALAAGCADTNSTPSSTLGVTPSGVVHSAADNSCPHDTPGAFRVDVVGTRVDFGWVSVPNITDYQIEIDRIDVVNAFVRAAMLITHNPTGAEWYGTVASHYRARLRTRTACGTFGVWSSYVEFSIDGALKVPTPPPVPPPPPDDDCMAQPTSLLPEPPACIANEESSCPPPPPTCESRPDRKS